MAKLIYQGEMAAVTGKREETLDASSMFDVMRYIDTAYGKPAQKAVKRCLVSLDGVGVEHIRAKDVSVNADSEVYFFPLCSGG